jgi:hypothetical protein
MDHLLYEHNTSYIDIILLTGSSHFLQGHHTSFRDIIFYYGHQTCYMDITFFQGRHTSYLDIPLVPWTSHFLHGHHTFYRKITLPTWASHFLHTERYEGGENFVGCVTGMNFLGQDGLCPDHITSPRPTTSGLAPIKKSSKLFAAWVIKQPPSPSFKFSF